ncbi:MAG: hypothetical protein HY015_11165 [Bacteroidetes bacterium]|nr:hypothetical protein [Bacteroidota bacterium]MBI3483510.1 hypothetical protein [Bacteroidota bacterium]
MEGVKPGSNGIVVKSVKNTGRKGIGCIGIAGLGAMVDFNSYLMGLAGTTNGAAVNAVITFLPAATPPLVIGPVVRSH